MEPLMYSFPHGILMSVEKESWEIGMETGSKPDSSGLAASLGSRARSVPCGCLGRDRHISTLLGLVQGGRKVVTVGDGGGSASQRG